MVVFFLVDFNMVHVAVVNNFSASVLTKLLPTSEFAE